MPRKQHVVRLAAEDRTALQRLVDAQTTPQHTAMRARVLLLTDAAHRQGGQTDAQIAARLGIADRTVARVRADWAARGREAIHRKPQPTPSRPPKLSDAQVLQVVALSLSDPPPGFATWSLRMLTDRAVELEIVDTVCHETIRRGLKKGALRTSARSSVS